MRNQKRIRPVAPHGRKFAGPVIKTFSDVLVVVDEVGPRRESTGRLAILLFQLVEVLKQPFSATGVLLRVSRVDDCDRKLVNDVPRSVIKR